MSLTNAMLTGFTGINSNTISVDTVGNNLANLNTTAFKGQRTLFETLLFRTVHEGDAPSDTGGGTLPFQIGTGSNVAALQRNFLQGSFEGSGFPSDLAIEGGGFFILAQPDGSQVYSRDGSFRLDADHTLVSVSGAPVQVFPANDAGEIDRSALSNLVIPLGSLSDAVATSQVTLEGQLDSGTQSAAAEAVVQSQALVTASGAAATAATPLTDLVDPFGVPLFSAGDVLEVNGSKGGISIAESVFVVGETGSSLGDLANHLETVLGINTDAETGGAPGVVISDGTDAPAGTLVIRSNLGEINAVVLDSGSIVNTTGAITSPLSFTTTQPPVGGGFAGMSTSFQVFDSLGSPVDVRLRMAMESQSDSGSVWRFYAESNGDSDLSTVLGTGTITFDANGRFVGATGVDQTLDRADSGATTPISFTLDFSGLTGLSSPDGVSEFSMATQDGKAAGELTGYSIATDGTVTVVYSNQLEQTIGQVALATFANNEGLVARSENTFVEGPNSGNANLVAPQTSGAGRVLSGMLEQSNVEIAREFINLIRASTGISAASRVVRASDDLLQELLLLAR